MGSTRACLSCGKPATPAGVLRPYERNPVAGGRQVKSRSQRRSEAMDLERHRGRVLAHLGDRDRIHPTSLPLWRYLHDEVEKAATREELDELAAEIPGAGLRWIVDTTRAGAAPRVIDAPVYNPTIPDEDDADWTDGGWDDQGAELARPVDVEREDHRRQELDEGRVFLRRLAIDPRAAVVEAGAGLPAPMPRGDVAPAAGSGWFRLAPGGRVQPQQPPPHGYRACRRCQHKRRKDLTGRHPAAIVAVEIGTPASVTVDVCAACYALLRDTMPPDRWVIVERYQAGPPPPPAAEPGDVRDHAAAMTVPAYPGGEYRPCEQCQVERVLDGDSRYPAANVYLQAGPLPGRNLCLSHAQQLAATAPPGLLVTSAPM